MDASLARLFSGGNDFDLCDKLFVRIVEAHNNKVDVATLNEEERVVYLVWGAAGVIDNGGFQFLFEHQLIGDPFYALSAQAFQTIGCHEAAEAFRETLALFPRSRPPRDLVKRLRLYNSRIESSPTEMDRRFFRAKDSITSCLADYIRQRYDSFKHLDKGGA